VTAGRVYDLAAVACQHPHTANAAFDARLAARFRPREEALRFESIAQLVNARLFEIDALRLISATDGRAAGVVDGEPPALALVRALERGDRERRVRDGRRSIRDRARFVRRGREALHQPSRDFLRVISERTRPTLVRDRSVGLDDVETLGPSGVDLVGRVLDAVDRERDLHLAAPDEVARDVHAVLERHGLRIAHALLLVRFHLP